MSTSPPSSSRSIGQWSVIVVFGLLSAAFLFRAVQFGAKWLRHVVEADLNFKAMTVWALVYVVICAAVAAAVYRMTGSDDEVDSQNAERGI